MPERRDKRRKHPLLPLHEVSASSYITGEIEKYITEFVQPYVSRDDRPWPCTLVVSAGVRDDLEKRLETSLVSGRAFAVTPLMKAIVDSLSPFVGRSPDTVVLITLVEHGKDCEYGGSVAMARAFSFISPIEMAALDALAKDRPDYPRALAKAWRKILAGVKSVEAAKEAALRDGRGEADPSKIREVGVRLANLEALVRGWKATTEAMADPALYAELRRPRP